MALQSPYCVVAGLGKTGVSCVHHLLRQGMEVAVTDSRAAPPGLAAIENLKSVRLRLGGLDPSLLEGASRLLLSPGISQREPIAVQARERGIEVLGDIELFARAVRAPVVAVTGTNGKSTVTTLVAHMAAADGRRVLAGGNLGTPALDLLEEPLPDLYVLELSSFQLETTHRLDLLAGVVLNVTADHLDRYDSFDDYADAKARLLRHAATAVLNVDDPRVAAMRRDGQPTLTFSLHAGHADFNVIETPEGPALARRGEALLALSRLKIGGLHNAANALAALALGECAGLSRAGMLSALERFAGLAHRSQWVARIGGVTYVNDSKGTNVGATLAAVQGSAASLVLIAGGDGKGQDFTPLATGLRGRVHDAVLIGRDAPALEAALSGICTTHRAGSMSEAVHLASQAANAGDTVLLSPACASLDMYRDYAQRGEAFVAAVRAMVQVHA